MDRSGSDVGIPAGEAVPLYPVSSSIHTCWKWSGDEIWCDVCNRVFTDRGSMIRHRARHFRPDLVNNPHCQWDFGQTDLRNGVEILWNDFMKDHDLPKVVFLYGDAFLYDKRKIWKREADMASWMPVYRTRKVRDDMTGEIHDAIICNSRWMHLDPDAKCASLAHVAAHVENHRHSVYDLNFNRYHSHNRDFSLTAISYDLHVENVPRLGFAMTLVTDAFRSSHETAMNLIARHHPITILRGASGEVRCSLSRKNTEDWTSDDRRNFEMEMVVPSGRVTCDSP